MFWIISAILIVIALVFIFPALLKRDYSPDATREQNISIAKEQLADIELRFEQGDIDQKSYQSTKDELELSLFNDLKESNDQLLESTNNNAPKRTDTWLILLLIPLIAIPTYLNLGNLKFTKQLDSKMVAQEAAKASMPLKSDGTPDVEKIAENLKSEMESNPTDPKGWYMLGRTYMMLNNFPDAANSFDKSLSLRPDLADTMLALADALSMSNNGQLIGRPRKLVNNALTIEPENITALWLSGMAASQESDYLEAITQWQKVIPFLDDKPDEKSAVIGLIAEAKSRLKPDEKAGLALIENQNQENAENNADIKDIGIKVNISLSDILKDKASPDDLVFIYAKAMTGPPMPLAAVRKQVKDLPFDVLLNDDMAMMPSLKLSSFKDVIVGARISKTGQPIANNGDLFAEKTEIKAGDSISIVINEVFEK